MGPVALDPINDEQVLERVAVVAAADAAPCEVMPGAEGVQEWTASLREGFRTFHRARFSGLAGPAHKQGWAVASRGEVVGVVRLQRHGTDTHEVGIWIAASRRGEGLATAALGALRARAAELGVHDLVADTTAANLAALAVLRHHGARLDHGRDGTLRGHLRVTHPTRSGATGRTGHAPPTIAPDQGGPS